jgi:hypothetical protein
MVTRFAYRSHSYLFHGYGPSLEIASQSTMHLEYQIWLGYSLFCVFSEIQYEWISQNGEYACCEQTRTGLSTYFYHGWGNIFKNAGKGKGYGLNNCIQ